MLGTANIKCLVDKINTDICTVGWLGAMMEIQGAMAGIERWHDQSSSWGKE